MSEKTNIAWCDSTVNFWSGCSKVSPGCAHCYAETRDKRHMVERVDHWGKGAPRLKSVTAVKQALALNRKPFICDKCGESYAEAPGQCRVNRSEPPSTPWICGCKTFHRRRIFSLSLGDWLDEEVPDEWRAEMLDTIRQCSDVIWILCTKRPENFFFRLMGTCTVTKMEKQTVKFIGDWLASLPPLNVILLTSVENQATADKRIPELLKIPAVCRGLSLEPLLEPVDLIRGIGINWEAQPLRWLIIGGESGAGARPCNVEWIRSLVRQGNAAGVATFVKQLGSNSTHWIEGLDKTRISMRDKKGADVSEWPVDLQVQQWPQGF